MWFQLSKIRVFPPGATAFDQSLDILRCHSKIGHPGAQIMNLSGTAWIPGWNSFWNENTGCRPQSKDRVPGIIDNSGDAFPAEGVQKRPCRPAGTSCCLCRQGFPRSGDHLEFPSNWAWIADCFGFQPFQDPSETGAKTDPEKTCRQIPTSTHHESYSVFLPFVAYRMPSWKPGTTFNQTGVAELFFELVKDLTM